MAPYPYIMGFGGLSTENCIHPLGIMMGKSPFSLSLQVPRACYYYILEPGSGGTYWAVYVYLNSPMERIQVAESHYSIVLKAMENNGIRYFTNRYLHSIDKPHISQLQMLLKRGQCVPEANTVEKKRYFLICIKWKSQDSVMMPILLGGGGGKEYLGISNPPLFKFRSSCINLFPN